MKLVQILQFILIAPLALGQVLQAQDWPDLAHYSKENTRIGLPKKGEKRVVFFGDSIIESWIKISPKFFSGRPYINRGISGQTTPQMLVRFRADVINLKPHAVVMLVGTNDIAGNTGPSTLEMIQNNITSMAELAKANGIKVILCSVLPVYEYPWKKGLHPAVKITTLNKWIKEYADKNKLIYIDYYSSLVDDRKGLKAKYTKDGVHPNEAGYKVMIPFTEQAINRALTVL